MYMIFSRLLTIFAFVICFTVLFSRHGLATEKKVSVQLAKIYSGQDSQSYLVSEKYDGVRAIWKNKKLRTRTGKMIHAPIWFTEGLPNIWLDGELWSARNKFELVMSTVSKDVPVDSEWVNIKYMVFDAPQADMAFRDRAKRYTSLLQRLELAHVQAVKQFLVKNNQELAALLTLYTQKGAEGLMLQKADAKFSDGRSSNLLKLKPYMDAEALVIKHTPGKGKYQNSLGALLVRYKNPDGKNIELKIGTGFSDRERNTPPKVGSVITFKYHGYTKNGVPRFASFMRVREQQNEDK
jgi:DNA ligase-1